MSIVKEKRETEEVIKPEDLKSIILYNDNNTFDHVIECLIKYCSHTEEQATQIAFIVHNNGKSDVKHGSLDKLIPIYNSLFENKLSVKIE